jgi:hypothetical protein
MLIFTFPDWVFSSENESKNMRCDDEYFTSSRNRYAIEGENTYAGTKRQVLGRIQNMNSLPPTFAAEPLLLIITRKSQLPSSWG